MDRQMMTWKARMMKKVNPPPRVVRTRKRTNPRHRRTRVLAAIEGSHGNKSIICRRLGICYSTLDRLLDRPGWEEVAEVFDGETQRLVDVAEKRVVEIAQQGLDLNAALRASTFILERRKKEYRQSSTSTVQVEGGSRPVQVQAVHINIPLEALGAPIDVRRAILETVEKVNGGQPVPVVKEEPEEEEEGEEEEIV